MMSQGKTPQGQGGLQESEGSIQGVFPWDIIDGVGCTSYRRISVAVAFKYLHDVFSYLFCNWYTIADLLCMYLYIIEIAL